MAYLVESIKQIRDERATRRRCTERLHQAKLLQVANETIRSVLAEGQRITPKVPLEGDDGTGEHAHPDHRQSRLSARKTRIQETQTRYHDQHHGRCYNDVRLISGLEPLVQVFDV